MFDIPDHDGRPPNRDDLKEAFRRIDADRRLHLFDGDRRVLRAAAAWDLGDGMSVHRELGMAVQDIAARLRISDLEVRRLLVGPEDLLIDEARRIIGQR